MVFRKNGLCLLVKRIYCLGVKLYTKTTENFNFMFYKVPSFRIKCLNKYKSFLLLD